jgi:hypothetical protein
MALKIQFAEAECYQRYFELFKSFFKIFPDLEQRRLLFLPDGMKVTNLGGKRFKLHN